MTLDPSLMTRRMQVFNPYLRIVLYHHMVNNTLFHWIFVSLWIVCGIVRLKKFPSYGHSPNSISELLASSQVEANKL